MTGIHCVAESNTTSRNLKIVVVSLCLIFPPLFLGRKWRAWGANIVTFLAATRGLFLVTCRAREAVNRKLILMPYHVKVIHNSLLLPRKGFLEIELGSAWCFYEFTPGRHLAVLVFALSLPVLFNVHSLLHVHPNRCVFGVLKELPS